MRWTTPMATLVIHEAAKLSPNERRRISRWLDEERRRLLAEGRHYSKRYRAVLEKNLFAGSCHAKADEGDDADDGREGL